MTSLIETPEREGGQPLASPQGQGGSVGRPPILSATPDLSRVWRSLCRRWWLATGLALTAAVLAAVGVGVLVPVRYQSAALLRVRGDVPGIIRDDQYQPERDFAAYKLNQQALAQSRAVVAAALRSPGIASLETIQEQGDNAVDWLRRSLSVSYPGKADFLEISLRGARRDELPKIVNAVAEACLKLGVEAEIGQREQRFRELSESYAENLEKIQQKQSLIYQTAKQLGTPDDTATQILMKQEAEELGSLVRRRGEARTQVSELDLKVSMVRGVGERPELMSASEEAVAAVWANDPELIALAGLQVRLAQRIYDARRKLLDPDSPRVQAMAGELDDSQRLLRERRTELQRQAVELSQPSDEGPNANLELLTMERKLLAENLTKLDQAIVDQQNKLTNLEKFSAALSTQKADLENLQAVNRSMGSELEIRRTELKAPPRVVLQQTAEVAKSSDALRKYALMGLASALCFVGVMIAVPYADAFGRRLGEPSDVSDGLGLDVVGRLPLSFDAKRAADSARDELGEAIDATRTVLVRRFGGGPRVVLVTSAAAGEGKTTTATQLAASFARLGKRTLLIDGCLRAPSAHDVFDLENDAGLCEALRQEVSVEDVIYPTTAEGLEMIPAGECDRGALLALARPLLEGMFARLRERYEWIVVDSGPLLDTADTLLLAQHADGVLLTAFVNETRLSALYEASERLHAIHAPLWGATIHGAPRTRRRHAWLLPARA